MSKEDKRIGKLQLDAFGSVQIRHKGRVFLHFFLSLSVPYWR